MKRHLFLGALFVVLIAALTIGKIAGRSAGKERGGTIQYSDQLLETAASELNKSLPLNIDKRTRLDFTKAGPGRRFSYYFTFVDAPASELDVAKIYSELAPIVRNEACASAGMRLFFAHGVVADYIYKGSDGNLVTSIGVALADCPSEPVSEAHRKPSMMPNIPERNPHEVFDVEGARKAGYTDDEIAGYLAKKHKLNLEGALAAGYKPAEIVTYLAKFAPASAPGAPGLDLAGFRREYPQYSDMSDDELARGLHSRFYSDMPFDQFAGLRPVTDEQAAMGEMGTLRPSTEMAKFIAHAGPQDDDTHDKIAGDLASSSPSANLTHIPLGFYECMLKRLPATMNDIAALAAMTDCRNQYPDKEGNSPPKPSHLFGYRSVPECVAAKARDTRSEVAAKGILTACSALY